MVAVAVLEECLKFIVVEHADFRFRELHVLNCDESFAGIELKYAANELVYPKAFVRCGALAATLVDQVLLEAQQVNTGDGRDG